MSESKKLSPEQDQFIEDIRAVFLKHLEHASEIRCRQYALFVFMEGIDLMRQNVPAWKQERASFEENLLKLFNICLRSALDAFQKEPANEEI